MRIPIIACLVASTSVAAARPQPLVASVEPAIRIEPSRIRLGAVTGGRIEDIAVTVRRHPRHVHVTVWLRLSTRSKDITEVSLPLELSSTITATGLALGAELGEPYTAEAARVTYDRTVSAIRDPALLEQTADDRYALRVFPIRRDEPGTLKIELELPFGAPLVLDPGRARLPEVALDLDGFVRHVPFSRRGAIELGGALEEPAAEEPVALKVDREISLLALPVAYQPRRTPVPTLAGWHPREQIMPTTIDLWSDRDVAKVADAHTEQLRHCFALGRRHNASLAISITKEGKVENVAVDDLDDANAGACIANEVASWTFKATHRSRTLRHALDVAVSDSQI